MALLNRKKKDSILPEVDKYYEGERKDRAGLAWLLATVSVILVALFIIILFFAGRWAYRVVFDNDQETQTVSTEEGNDQNNVPSIDGGSTEEDSDNNSDETSNSQNKDENQEQTDQNTAQNNNEGEVDAPAQTQTPNQPSTTGEAIPGAGDSPLPGTGPSNILSIFLITSIVAGLLHRLYSQKISKN